jgi:hypothetical protein
MKKEGKGELVIKRENIPCKLILGRGRKREGKVLPSKEETRFNGVVTEDQAGKKRSRTNYYLCDSINISFDRKFKQGRK